MHGGAHPKSPHSRDLRMSACMQPITYRETPHTCIHACQDTALVNGVSNVHPSAVFQNAAHICMGIQLQCLHGQGCRVTAMSDMHSCQSRRCRTRHSSRVVILQFGIFSLLKIIFPCSISHSFLKIHLSIFGLHSFLGTHFPNFHLSFIPQTVLQNLRRSCLTCVHEHARDANKKKKCRTWDGHRDREIMSDMYSPDMQNLQIGL